MRKADLMSVLARKIGDRSDLILLTASEIEAYCTDLAS